MPRNARICKRCGGECCQAMPGAVDPADVGDRATAQAMLDSGRYAVDWLNVYNPEYFLRPAIKGGEGQRFDYASGGPCTFWSAAAGCELPYKRRPLQCRTLRPISARDCVNDVSLDDIATAWAWHRDWLLTDAEAAALEAAAALEKVQVVALFPVTVALDVP